MENSNVEIIAPQGDEMVQLPDCLSSPPPPMPPPFPDVIAQDDKKNSPLPRAFITTDIHSMTWDPDDIQSLGHVLYFLDRLDLRGIVPDHFNNNGAFQVGRELQSLTLIRRVSKLSCAFQAVDKVLNAYTDDYYNPSTKYQDLGWPTPEHVKSLVAYSKGEAVQDLINQAHDAADNGQVLYVLAWGHVCVTKDALLQDPSIAPHIRLLSIATFKKAKSDGGNCWEDNWNEWGGCRNTIYSQFPNVWFLESDWSYQGIYLPWKNQAGIDMKNSLEALGGKVGKVIGDAIDVVSWSNSFRVGDTPTVLYLIDPSNDLDDPGKGALAIHLNVIAGSWAGRYMRPYPDAHPNFWTGITGGNWWDFNNPCNSWGNAQAVFDARQWTVQSKKPEMYDDLLERGAGASDKEHGPLGSKIPGAQHIMQAATTVVRDHPHPPRKAPAPCPVINVARFTTRPPAYWPSQWLPASERASERAIASHSWRALTTRRGARCQRTPR
eukprot:scaffold1534_cov391-Prasinococcus_capsulatus_cf.AAC.5